VTRPGTAPNCVALGKSKGGRISVFPVFRVKGPNDLQLSQTIKVSVRSRTDLRFYYVCD
jgi:hypothetical protein